KGTSRDRTTGIVANGTMERLGALDPRPASFAAGSDTTENEDAGAATRAQPPRPRLSIPPVSPRTTRAKPGCGDPAARDQRGDTGRLPRRESADRPWAARAATGRGGSGTSGVHVASPPPSAGSPPPRRSIPLAPPPARSLPRPTPAPVPDETRRRAHRGRRPAPLHSPP